MSTRKQLRRCALLAALLCQPLACGEEPPLQLGKEFVSLGRVSPDGGTLCVGALCLAFPPGAPDKAVILTGDICELSATVNPFKKAIKLTLPLPNGLSASEARVFWRGEASGKWKATHRTADQPAGGVTVTTSHLSLWAVGKPAS